MLVLRLSGDAVAEAALGLGSNLGDRALHLANAAHALDGLEDTRVAAVSSLWETPPWGKTDQPHFLNACILIETSLTPIVLLEACLRIERAHGRQRSEHWGARTLDIDLLYYDDLVLETEALSLPHPRIILRSFVLAPLAELAPQRLIAGASVATHLDRLGMEGLRRDGPFPDWRR